MYLVDFLLAVLEANPSRCLDSDDDRRAVARALTDALTCGVGGCRVLATHGEDCGVGWCAEHADCALTCTSPLE